MAQELHTVEEVIQQLGGSTAVMSLTGSAYVSTVSNWKKRGTFPANTRDILTEALSQRSFCAPASLWGMREATNA